MKNKKELDNLLKKFKIGNYDWMGFKKCPGNYFSFHHIIKIANGGKKLKNNGAVLTVNAHQLLHFVEMACIELYEEWTELFMEIIAWNQPLTEYHVEKIMLLKNETLGFIDCINEEREKAHKSRILYK